MVFSIEFNTVSVQLIEIRDTHASNRFLVWAAKAGMCLLIQEMTVPVPTLYIFDVCVLTGKLSSPRHSRAYRPKLVVGRWFLRVASGNSSHHCQHHHKLLLKLFCCMQQRTFIILDKKQTIYSLLLWQERCFHHEPTHRNGNAS